MKQKRKGFIDAYWKRAKKAPNPEPKEEFVSNRASLLKKIKAKKQKKDDAKPAPIKKETDEEKDLSEILGFEVKIDKSTVDREKGVGKKELSAEEIEKKKQDSLAKKDKNSARDNLIIKIKEIEDQISKTKYNKKTQHAIGLMKAQVATLKTKLAGQGKKSGAKNDGYAVRKTGDGTVVLLGFPSAGKSTLLNNITGAESEVGNYAFTTLSVVPGMLEYKQAKIQILDVPGIVEGAAAGTGRGKEVLQVIRNADLILMLIDAFKPQQEKLLLKEVYDTNIRLNQKKPDIKIRRTSKDGIRIGRTVPTPDLDDATVDAMLRQFKIMNADVLIRDEINSDQFIDVVEGNKIYIPSITVINKMDLLTKPQLTALKKFLNPNLCISAHENEHLDELKEVIYNKLDFIRIYLKEVNKKADMEVPMIMLNGSTIKDLCSKLHKDFVEKFSYARIWGPSAKFDGQKLMKMVHTLKDGDVVELHIK